MDGQPRLVNDFLTYLTSERHLSPFTVRAYRSDLQQFREFVALTDPATVDIDTGFTGATLDILKAFIEDLSKTAQPRSLRRKTATLRSFFKWLRKTGRIQSNPTLSLRWPTLRVAARPALTIEQFTKLRAAPDTSTLLGVRDLALIEVMGSTGDYPSRLALLDQADVIRDQAAGKTVLRIKRKQTVEVTLSEIAALALARYQAFRAAATTHEMPLFVNKHGSRLSSRSIRRKVEKYITVAGIGPGVDMHNLRQTFKVTAATV